MTTVFIKSVPSTERESPFQFAASWGSTSVALSTLVARAFGQAEIDVPYQTEFGNSRHSSILVESHMQRRYPYFVVNRAFLDTDFRYGLGS